MDLKPHYSRVLISLYLRVIRAGLSLSFALGLILCFLWSGPAHACPNVAGFRDANCDGQFTVTIVGDSFVYGTGDEKNGGRGGYVRRAADALPSATVYSIGKPGYGTARMLRFLSKNLRSEELNRVQLAVRESDVIIVDIGRNDFWSAVDSGLTVRNIGRISELLHDFASTPDGCRPAVGVATMLPSSRIGERGFVADITRKLLVQKQLGRIPVYLYFDSISKALLAPDGLHPSSAGYDAMAAKVVRFIRTAAQTILDLIARESLGTGRESCYKD